MDEAPHRAAREIRLGTMIDHESMCGSACLRDLTPAAASDRMMVVGSPLRLLLTASLLILTFIVGPPVAFASNARPGHPQPRALARLSALQRHEAARLRLLAKHLHPVAKSPSRRPLRPRIVGGSSAVQGQLPFMAFIAYFLSSTSSEICSGTLVAPNVVLTAGHCTVDEDSWTTNDPGGFAVVTGAADWTDATSRQVSSVAEVIPYPGFDPSDLTSDAGLLVLSAPVDAPTIGLPTNADDYLQNPGTGAGIAGWGGTYSGSPLPDVLQWGDTVVQGPAYCDQFAGGGLAYSPPFGLCSVNAPFYDTATCPGDSGGPLFSADAAGRLIELGITELGTHRLRHQYCRLLHCHIAAGVVDRAADQPSRAGPHQPTALADPRWSATRFILELTKLDPSPSCQRTHSPTTYAE